LTADSTTPEKRGTGLSIITLINNVATTPAPIVMGIIVSVFTRPFGMRLAYTITVLSFFVAAAFRSRLKETIERPQRIRFTDLFRHYPQAVKQSFSVWKTLPKSVPYLFVVSALTMFAFSLSSLFLAVYAVEGQESVLHVNQADWAILNTTLFLMMILVAFPIGKVIDRYSRRIPLALSFLLMITAVLLFVYGDLFRLFLAFPVMGTAQILFFASHSTLQTDYVPSDKRGKVVGSSNFVNSIVGGLAQLTGGMMYDISHQLPFLIILPVLAVAFTITLLLISEPQKRQD
jgi:MFS family permease